MKEQDWRLGRSVPNVSLFCPHFFINLLLIEAFAFADPPSVKEYEMFLRELVHGEMLAGRHPILDGAVLELKPDGSEIVHGTPLPDDFHAIRAALVLLRLLPNDETVLAALHHWIATHPDEKVRQKLKQRLEM